MSETQTVREWIASHCRYGISEFEDQIAKYGHLQIVREFDGTEFSFPQTSYSYRNVMNWVLLEDGSAVGWNESPRTGWSFPRSSKRITAKYMEAFKAKGLIDVSVPNSNV